MKRQTRSTVKLAKKSPTPGVCIVIDDSSDDEDKSNQSIEIVGESSSRQGQTALVLPQGNPVIPIVPDNLDAPGSSTGRSDSKPKRISRKPAAKSNLNAKKSKSTLIGGHKLVWADPPSSSATASASASSSTPLPTTSISNAVSVIKRNTNIAAKKRRAQPPQPEIISLVPSPDSTYTSNSSGDSPQLINSYVSGLGHNDTQEETPRPAKRSKVTPTTSTSFTSPILTIGKKGKHKPAKTSPNRTTSKSRDSFPKSLSSFKSKPAETGIIFPKQSTSKPDACKTTTTSDTGLTPITDDENLVNCADFNPCGSIDSFTDLLAKYQTNKKRNQQIKPNSAAAIQEVQDEENEVDEFSVTLSQSSQEDDSVDNGTKSKVKLSSNFLNSPTTTKIGKQAEVTDELCNEIDELLGGVSKTKTNLTLKNRNPPGSKNVRNINEDDTTDEELDGIVSIPVNQFEADTSFLELSFSTQSVIPESINQEFNVRIRWKGGILLFPMKETDLCSQLRAKFSQKVGINPSELLITYDDEDLGMVTFSDTKTLREAKIQLGTVLDGAVKPIGFDSTSSTKDTAQPKVHNPNHIRIKCQSSDRKSSVEMTVDGKDGKVRDILVGYALKMGMEPDRIKRVMFDGERLNPEDGLDELELDGGECFDIILE